MSARSLKKKSQESSLKASDRQSIEEKPEKQPVQDQQAKIIKEVQQKKRAYWTSAARKLRKGRELAQKAVQQKQYYFNEQILQGKYEIKERQWSAHQQKNTHSRTKLTNSAILTKKDLQNQLHGIESRINEEIRQKANKMMSEEEHHNFMKKIQQQRKQQQQRRLQAAKQEEQQRNQQQNRIKEENQRQQIQRKNKKRQELIDKLKYIEQQRKKQAQIYQQQQQLLKQKTSEKTMADKMGDQYNFKQNQFLEEKKKKLAEIRALHKPIDKSQLDSFSHKLDQLHEAKQKARENKQFGLKNSVNKFYRSAFYKRVQDGEKSKIFHDSKHQEELLKRRQNRDKLKRYSEHVWQDYKPTIDEKKAEELKFRGHSLKQKSYSTSQQLQNPRKLGLRYLQYNKINHKLLGSNEDQEESEEDDKKNKKFDYLAQLRERNKKMHPLTAQGLIERLDKKHLPKQQKQKQILDFTQRLQMKAKRREEVQKIGGGVSQQLDALYLQAIEAKLSLLDLDHQ